MRGSKNACWNVQNAKPPANSVTEVTPEKELKKVNNNNSTSSPPSSTATSVYNRKKGGGNKTKAIDVKIEDDHSKNNNNNIEEYSAIEDENHPDFGTNGFLNAERFTNGDRLPLLNNNAQESKMVPSNLEIQQKIVQSQTDTSDGMHRSGSSTTITTSSTGEGANRMRFAITEGDFEDEEEERANGRGAARGEEMEFVGADNPVYEPYTGDIYGGGGEGNQPSRNQSQFTPYFNNNGQSPRQLFEVTPNMFGVLSGENGKENEQQQQIEGGGNKMVQTNNSTIGTNTISIGGGGCTGGGRIYYPQQNGENNANSTLVPYILNMQPPNRQQQIDREQNYQKAEQRRNMQKRKQLSKEKAQIIKPQEQPGYVGDKDLDDIYKIFGIKDQAAHKSNSPSAVRGGGLENSNGKKGNKKQKQKHQRISQNGRKRQQQFGGGGRQESYASPEDEEEEMDVDIELDNGNGGGGDDLVGAEPQLARREEVEDEEKTKKAGKKAGGEGVWCSSSLADRKKKLRQQQQAMRQTPLLDRIPANVLAELRGKCGWSNPITIVSPFCTIGSSMAESKKKMGEKEREAIWNGPADRWLEQKPKI